MSQRPSDAGDRLQRDSPTPISPLAPTPPEFRTSIEALDLATTHLDARYSPGAATDSQRQELDARRYIARSNAESLDRTLPGRASSLRRDPALLPLLYMPADNADEYSTQEQSNAVSDDYEMRQRGDGGNGDEETHVGREGEEEDEDEPTTPLLDHERPPSTSQESAREPGPETRKIWQLPEYKVYFDRRQDRIRRGLPPSPPSPTPGFRSTTDERSGHSRLQPGLEEDFASNATSYRASIHDLPIRRVRGLGRSRGGRGRGYANDSDDLAPLNDAMIRLAVRDFHLRERRQQDAEHDRQARRLEAELEEQEVVRQVRVHDELASSGAVYRGSARRRTRGGRVRGGL